VIASPVAILTGVSSWWFNHGHRVTRIFKGKSALAAALFPMQVATVVLWTMNRDALADREAIGWLCLALVIVMCGLVVLLGKLGGQLVFPPRKKKR
jgi:uncharacterized membrane protein